MACGGGGRAAGEDLYQARSDPTHTTCYNGVYPYGGMSDLTHSLTRIRNSVFMHVNQEDFKGVIL